MDISYKPLWHTLLERGMSKEDLRVKAKLTTNAIANMGKNRHISMATLLKICEALHCNFDDVVEITDFVPDTEEITLESASQINYAERII